MSNTLKGKELLAEEDERDQKFESLAELKDHLEANKESAKWEPSLGEMQGLAELKEGLKRKEQQDQRDILSQIQERCWDKVIGDGSEWEEIPAFINPPTVWVDEDTNNQFIGRGKFLRDMVDGSLHYIADLKAGKITLGDTNNGRTKTYKLGRMILD